MAESARPRSDGIRRRHRRRRPGRARRRDPAQADFPRHQRRGGGKGLGGRRAYPVRRGDRSDRRSTGCCRNGAARTRRSRPRSPTTASTGSRPSARLRLPNFMMPPLMSNHGNYIVSLGNVCRWLATKAEALGVEIYPGFAAAEVLFERRRGGRRRHRRHGHRQGRRAATRASPAAWSCAPNTRCSPKARAATCRRQLIAKFGLADGREPQKFGIGLKELWQVAPDKHKPGLVQHSFGWPLDNSHRRRLVPLSLRRQSGVGRLRASISTTPIPICRRSRNSSASRPIR